MLSLQNSKTFSSGKEDRKGEERIIMIIQQTSMRCKGAIVLYVYSSVH